jgi:hypothetical protein
MSAACQDLRAMHRSVFRTDRCYFATKSETAKITVEYQHLKIQWATLSFCSWTKQAKVCK